jgi:plasmid stabilization system protein ParE
MLVVITASAENDLIEIGEFIRPNNPKRAISFIDELLERCYSLADMPYAFQVIKRYKQLEIRRYPYRDYLIFYRVKSDRLEVIRIIRGERDYGKLLD